MFNPDQALAELRADVAEWQAHGADGTIDPIQAMETLTGRFTALDESVSGGQALPSNWTPKHTQPPASGRSVHPVTRLLAHLSGHDLRAAHRAVEQLYCAAERLGAVEGDWRNPFEPTMNALNIAITHRSPKATAG